MIPINRKSADPFYRYKMPPLHVIREGKQGNPRSIIMNFLPVCDSLRRSPELIKQFFIYQLSVQIKMKNDKLVINGEIKGDILQDILYQFIDLLLICRQCDNPETSIRTMGECDNPETFTRTREECNQDFTEGGTENESGYDSVGHGTEDGARHDGVEQNENEPDHQHGSGLVLECYACGAITPIRSNHKIISYILKNQACLEGENRHYVGMERDGGVKSLEGTAMSQNEQVSYFRSVVERVFDRGEYALLKDLEQALKKEEGRVQFFEVLEEYSVKNDIVQNIGRVFDVLREFLTGTDFEYFKKRSRVVHKKESVRIRNILSNYVDYKE